MCHFSSFIKFCHVVNSNSIYFLIHFIPTFSCVTSIANLICPNYHISFFRSFFDLIHNFAFKSIPRLGSTSWFSGYEFRFSSRGFLFKSERIDPIIYIGWEYIKILISQQHNRILIHKSTYIRFIIPEEVVIQSRFTVAILVLQAEGFGTHYTLPWFPLSDGLSQCSHQTRLPSLSAISRGMTIWSQWK